MTKLFKRIAIFQKSTLHDIIKFPSINVKDVRKEDNCRCLNNLQFIYHSELWKYKNVI